VVWGRVRKWRRVGLGLGGKWMRVKEVEKWFGRVLGRNKERGIGEMFKMKWGYDKMKWWG
jgi:hypothetical protein